MSPWTPLGRIPKNPVKPETSGELKTMHEKRARARTRERARILPKNFLYAHI